MKIPEVILLTNYDKLPNKSATFCRREIWKRDNYKCQYCGIKCQDDLTLDHVIPRSLGGETSWVNCVLACSSCNSQKADRVPVGYESHGTLAVRLKGHKNWIGESPMQLAKEPVKPKFSLFKGRKPTNLKESWKHWLNKMYWEIPLINDMKEEDLFD